MHQSIILYNRPPLIRKGVYATLQSGIYTFSYARGRYVKSEQKGYRKIKYSCERFSFATHFKSSSSLQVENCDINSRFVVDVEYNS